VRARAPHTYPKLIPQRNYKSYLILSYLILYGQAPLAASYSDALSDYNDEMQVIFFGESYSGLLEKCCSRLQSYGREKRAESGSRIQSQRYFVAKPC